MLELEKYKRLFVTKPQLYYCGTLHVKTSVRAHSLPIQRKPRAKHTIMQAVNDTLIFAR